MQSLAPATDLIVFSSRPFGSDEVRTTETMVRFSPRRRIFFLNSPILEEVDITPYYTKIKSHHLQVIQAHISKELSVFEQHDQILDLVRQLIIHENIQRYTIWTDTPAAVAFIRYLNADIIVYDCLQDHGVTTYKELEIELYEYTDAILTSGQTCASHFPQLL